LSSILLTSVATTGLSQQAFADPVKSEVKVTNMLPFGDNFFVFLSVINSKHGITTISITTSSDDPVVFMPSDVSSNCIDSFSNSFLISATSFPLTVTVIDCKNNPSTDIHTVEIEISGKEICTPPSMENAAGECVDPPLECLGDMILNVAGDACVEPPLECLGDTILNVAGDACVCPTGQIPGQNANECIVEISSPTNSKQELKLAVINDLTVLKDSTDKETDKKIDRAIKHIEKSLKDELWEYDNILDSEKGKEVFYEEAKAVKDLKKILNKVDVSATTVILSAIGTLVDIDRMLAQEAIDSVPTDTGNKKVDEEIVKAIKNMEEAEKELEKNESDKAIKKFKRAWEHAQNALKEL